jgi:isopenicillin-N epimerase
MQSARKSLADYLGTKPDNLVYTTNVTESLNIVARSLNLGPGDEVLSTDHEYGALDRTWRFLAKERGFVYINQPIPVPPTTQQAFTASLWKGVTPRTRVIFLSHITSPTGLIFPVEDVAKRARQAGIISVVDGAHAPGQIPLMLDGIEADFYGGNLHKWLCAPKGAGFLYARPEVQHLLKPLVISWGYEAETPGPSKIVDLFEWTGTRDIASFLSVQSAIEFQEKYDWQKVRSACHELVQEANMRICALNDMPSHADESWYMQFTAIPLPEDTDLVSLKSRLYDEYRIEVPVILWNKRKLLRVSVQGYNTRRDIEKLVEALRKLLRFN